MVIAITNQKGGIGKTALSINLSSALSHLGYRVLTIDLDPQGNTSDGLGIQTSQETKTIYDVLVNDMPISDIIVQTKSDNLYIVPSNMNLFGAEAELSTDISRPFKLRKAIKPEIFKYDFIVIDCPPNLGILTVNAILASTDLLVPIEPNSYALKGMSVLMNTILKIQNDLEHFPNFLGVAVNMYNPQNMLHNSIVNNITEYFPAGKVFDTRIHRTPMISEAEIHGQSVIQYNKHHKASKMFISLAKEISVKYNESRQTRQEETAR